MLSCDLPAEQMRRGIDRAVEEMLAEVALVEPPVSAIAVAKSLGLYVSFDRRLANRARFVRVQGAGGGIFLRQDDRPERLQWAAAHELGEASASRIAECIGANATEFAPRDREKLANQFAAALLLPAAWFARVGDGCDWELPALKAAFSTASHELIARRMLQFAPESVVTIFDEGRLTFRGRSYEGRSPPPNAAELAAQRGAHHDAKPSEHWDELQRIRAWPIHEPHWRREILRTEQPGF